MKKSLIISAIILWAAVALAFTFLYIYGVNGEWDSDTLLKSEEIPLNNTQNIIIDCTHHGVEIRKIEGDRIKVSQYGNEKVNNLNLYMVSQKDGNINIHFEKNRRFNILNLNNFNEKLIIEIPESFVENLNISTVSGGIKIESEFILNNVYLKTTSGGIRINEKLIAASLNATAVSGGIHTGDVDSDEKFAIDTTSGGVHINGTVTTGEFSAKTVSGGINLDTVTTEKYYLKSTSGRIRVTNSISGTGEAKTTSGGITLSLTNPHGDIRVATTSGGIRLSLEHLLEFTLDAATTSGSIRANFELEKNNKGNHATAKIGENPTVNIIAKANSGGIRVEN